MARRARRTARVSSKPETDEAPEDLLEKNSKASLIATIMNTKGIKAIAFEAKSMFTTPVKMADGKYKQKPIDQGDDFTLSGMRVGSRGQFIFEFLPIDPKDYVQMELDESKVFAVFEGFEAMVVKAMGLIPAPKLAGERPYEQAYEWPEGSKHWLRNERKRLLREQRDEEEAFKRTEEEKLEKARKEQELAYSANPLYGSW
jgi:hypothetical protein